MPSRALEVHVISTAHRPLTPDIRAQILQLAQQGAVGAGGVARLLDTNHPIATAYLDELVSAGELRPDRRKGRTEYLPHQPMVDARLVTPALKPVLLGALAGKSDTVQHLARHLQLDPERVAQTLLQLQADGQVNGRYVGALTIYSAEAVDQVALCGVLGALDPAMARSLVALARQLGRRQLSAPERIALEYASQHGLAVRTSGGYRLGTGGRRTGRSAA